MVQKERTVTVHGAMVQVGGVLQVPRQGGNSKIRRGNGLLYCTEITKGGGVPCSTSPTRTIK